MFEVLIGLALLFCGLVQWKNATAARRKRPLVCCPDAIPDRFGYCESCGDPVHGRLAR
jgi:RNA polymerase-binding transcription factor DksA